MGTSVCSGLQAAAQRNGDKAVQPPPHTCSVCSFSQETLAAVGTGTPGRCFSPLTASPPEQCKWEAVFLELIWEWGSSLRLRDWAVYPLGSWPDPTIKLLTQPYPCCGTLGMSLHLSELLRFGKLFIEVVLWSYGVGI